ncbi:acyl carrier protein [Aspergillus udagawae]|uniref:Acyl carrier protein n=1 Tax=Aspergillus udagawae TaxID=91492 RepID=A0ABQ1B6G0_9EURO|nr:acyl carrier protein [Aspergillus udagawae]GFF94670.1 acyl carrier protein [Aspergillus udagawae]GFG17390.1 acyl carrier protein [Aspergillus udagawae]
MASIEEQVKKIISEHMAIDEQEIKLDSSFIDDLGCDSLDAVELQLKTEEEFGIEIEDEDAEMIRTVRDLVYYINKIKNS